MIYIFEDSRILYDESLLTEEDEGKYLEFEELPEVPFKDGYFGYWIANLTTQELEAVYVELEPQPEPPKPSSAELRNKAYQELLYKQDGITPLILFDATIYTCDKAFAQIKVYEEEDKYSGGNKAEQIGKLWAEAKDYIRSIYPPENSENEPFLV